MPYLHRGRLAVKPIRGGSSPSLPARKVPVKLAVARWSSSVRTLGSYPRGRRFKSCLRNVVRAMRQGVCNECGDEFWRRPAGKDGMVYCSSSCSAKHHNKLRPKKVHFCECGAPKANKSRKTCFGCFKMTQDQIYSVALKDLRKAFSPSQFHAKVRGWSRNAYDGPMVCFVCGYSLHVDIAHIKGVATFEEETLLSVVNAVNNLIALCKNHHWEYDNGYLELALSPSGKAVSP